MSSRTKRVLGFATIVWPAIVFLSAFLIRSLDPDFKYYLLVSVTIGWIFFSSLFVFSVFHVVKNPDLSGSRKNRWMIYLLIFNMFAVPVYWFRYILRKNVES